MTQGFSTSHPLKPASCLSLVASPAPVGSSRSSLPTTAESKSSSFLSEAYNAVLLINVLEDAVDPIAILKVVGRLLRPDGIALVATPNTGSAAFKVFRGRHWSGYDFPRHRNLFCPEALARTAAMADLEVISLATSPAPSAWIQSARIMMSDWAAPHWALTTLDRVWGIALSAAAGIEWFSQIRTEGGVLIATLRRAA